MADAPDRRLGAHRRCPRRWAAWNTIEQFRATRAAHHTMLRCHGILSRSEGGRRKLNAGKRDLLHYVHRTIRPWIPQHCEGLLFTPSFCSVVPSAAVFCCAGVCRAAFRRGGVCSLVRCAVLLRTLCNLELTLEYHRILCSGEHPLLQKLARLQRDRSAAQRRPTVTPGSTALQRTITRCNVGQHACGCVVSPRRRHLRSELVGRPFRHAPLCLNLCREPARVGCNTPYVDCRRCNGHSQRQVLADKTKTCTAARGRRRTPRCSSGRATRPTRPKQ